MSKTRRDDDPDSGYWLEGPCDACGARGPLGERRLCGPCDEAFERDLVRLRRWDVSGLGAGLGEAAREALRREVLARHGGALEILEMHRLGERGISS